MKLKRGMILEGDDNKLCIYLKKNNSKTSYVVQLDIMGNPVLLDLVETKKLKRPISVPDDFKQIDITLDEN